MSMWLAVRVNKGSTYVAHEVTDPNITFRDLTHQLSTIHETDVVTKVN